MEAFYEIFVILTLKYEDVIKLKVPFVYSIFFEDIYVACHLFLDLGYIQGVPYIYIYIYI